MRALVTWLLTLGFANLLWTNVLCAIFAPPITSNSGSGWIDRRHLGNIGKARLIYESDHGPFPAEALKDIYSFAAELARGAEIDDAGFWYSRKDPAYDMVQPPAGHVLDTQSRTKMNPNFNGSPVAFAAAMLPRVMAPDIPPGTPLIWTRGLQADGTWRADSPYRGVGGAICFVGGNVQQLDTLVGYPLLHKWGTQEPTVNIREALPPGTRIAEYTPPPEVLAHAHWMDVRAKIQHLAGWLIPLLLSLACSIVITSPKRPKEKVVIILIGFIGIICAVFAMSVLLDSMCAVQIG